MILVQGQFSAALIVTLKFALFTGRNGMKERPVNSMSIGKVEEKPAMRMWRQRRLSRRQRRSVPNAYRLLRKMMGAII